MANHENYTGYRPQQPIGKSGISTETFYSEQPKSIVDTPIHQVRGGLPAQMPVIRPQRSVHPYFTQYISEPEAAGDGIPSTDAPGGSAIGKHIAGLAETADADDFTPAEQMHLIALMDAEPGVSDGWQSLDVWE